MLKPIKQLLQDEFKCKLSKRELSLLPSSYQKIGNIVILNLKEKLWKHDKKIGKIILEKIPDTKTVCRRIDFIKSQYRKPALKIIAGGKKTETLHKEHGIVYRLDVNEIMFAKGNLNERNRISKLVNKNEVVVDMFAGLGYFSLGIAKTSKPKTVYSIEINPITYSYLKKNIELNKVENKIIPIIGDCIVELPNLGRIADRVIMGLLPSCREYLIDAMRVIKPNGIMHYHGTAKEWKELLDDVKIAADIEGLKVKLIEKTRVKSYAPKIYHWVLDCRILASS
jgi:tRNA wybutosine-synthesizing protein 2